MAHATPPVFLVADIGGTNTRVALSDGENVLSETIRRYRNAEHPGLEVVLKQYLAAEGDIVPRAACVAVAGPVRDGKGRLTNLDWDMDEAGLAKAIGAGHVAMLNDLQAQGYALDHVSDADMMLVRQGADGPEGAPRLVVNLGTGFNASPVFVAPSGPFVATSESGHATMPVRTEQDMRLCRFVAHQHGFAAIDDILSGRGLEHIYAFLSHEAGKNDALTSTAIMEGCASRADPLTVETVAYFTRLAATVMGNLALVQLPFGGIYMVGGLSSAIAPYMAEFDFDAAFRKKGRFADFMDNFSIYVLQDDYAALKGTAAYLHGLVAQQEQA